MSTIHTDLVERLREAGNDYTVAWGSGDLYDAAADEIERLRAQVAALEAREPRRPDLLERLSYHALERDDLTVEDCIEYLANGWTRVHGRTERQMVMQLLHLMAGGYASEREAALEAERDRAVEQSLASAAEVLRLVAERDALRVDAERLDWMERTQKIAHPCYHEERRPTTKVEPVWERVQVFDGWVCPWNSDEEHPTMRAAIDAARSKT